MTLCSWFEGGVCDTPDPLWCNKKAQNPGMKVVLPQINFIWSPAPTMSVTYTAVLPVRAETVDFLAGLLIVERLRRGTRERTRALSVHGQAVLVLRWFLDGTRMAQLAVDNTIGTSTGAGDGRGGVRPMARRPSPSPWRSGQFSAWRGRRPFPCGPAGPLRPRPSRRFSVRPEGS